ncbi:MAG: hypothetical protein JWM53_1199 [bacterium]|nr:hypothetical protein [bacterium]
MIVAAGCSTPEWAVIGGKRVARPTVAYDNGQTFRLEHRRAFPGVFDPARGRDVDDGRLRGRVCGVDLAFDAMWYGARLMLEGRGEVPWKQDFTRTEGLFKLTFDITELGPGHRRIRGSMTGGPSMIDLDVSPEALVGQIGLRRFTLAADGGYLIGRYERHGDVERPIDELFAIWGREALRTMVPADEALLLVMMLTCDGTIELDGKKLRGFTLVRISQP